MKKHQLRIAAGILACVSAALLIFSIVYIWAVYRPQYMLYAQSKEDSAQQAGTAIVSIFLILLIWLPSSIVFAACAVSDCTMGILLFTRKNGVRFPKISAGLTAFDFLAVIMLNVFAYHTIQIPVVLFTVFSAVLLTNAVMRIVYSVKGKTVPAQSE